MTTKYDPSGTSHVFDTKSRLRFRPCKPQPMVTPKGVTIFELCLNERFLDIFEIKSIFSSDEKSVEIIVDVIKLKNIYDESYIIRCHENSITPIIFDEFCEFIKLATKMHYAPDFAMVWEPDPPPNNSIVAKRC